jgi:hypothetical protein
MTGGSVQTMVRLVESDCRRWYAILCRLPVPLEYVAMKTSDRASGALGASWVPTAMNRSTDYEPFEMVRGSDGIVRKVHARPVIRPVPASAAEISFMDAMFDVILTLGVGTLPYLLVTGRAQRIPWVKLRPYDPDRRGTRSLQRLHADALHQLLSPWLRTIHKM